MSRSFVECPQCQRQYPPGTWKCLHDGFLLPPSGDDDQLKLAPSGKQPEEDVMEEPTEVGGEEVANHTNPRTAFMHVEELIDTEHGDQGPVLEPTREEIPVGVDDDDTAVVNKKRLTKAALADLEGVIQHQPRKAGAGDGDEETAVVSRAVLQRSQQAPPRRGPIPAGAGEPPGT